MKALELNSYKKNPYKLRSITIILNVNYRKNKILSELKRLKHPHPQKNLIGQREVMVW